MSIRDFVRPRPGLLISVRDTVEAEAALRGGADLIDVKEPAHGALGRASNATIAAIVRLVGGRRPVSAALGDLPDDADLDLAPQLDRGVALAKIGLAGCRRRPNWATVLDERVRNSIHPAQLVVVAYADWQRADAPAVRYVALYALIHQCGLLIDTWKKDGSTLLDWINLTEVSSICSRFRRAGVPIALAGTLGISEIERLQTVVPDWFGVRGSACGGGNRAGAIQAHCVMKIKAILSAFQLPLQKEIP